MWLQEYLSCIQKWRYSLWDPCAYIHTACKQVSKNIQRDTLRLPLCLIHWQFLAETQVCIETSVDMQSFPLAQPIPDVQTCNHMQSHATCVTGPTSAHALSNILKFLLPTHFCAFFIGLYRGLWHYSNKNSLPQTSFHAGSVTNIHTQHWIAAADIPNTTLYDCRWMGHSCPAKCKPVTGIGIPAYHSEWHIWPWTIASLVKFEGLPGSQDLIPSLQGPAPSSAWCSSAPPKAPSLHPSEALFGEE